MTRIVLTRSMLPSDVGYIQNGLDRVVKGKYELVVPPDFTEEAIAESAVEADVLLGPYVTQHILGKCRKLKLIQIPWTGMDTFDFSAVEGCRVPICNTHSNADSVAEFGMALTLDLLKKVSFHDRKMRKGNWNREQKPLTLKSVMLSSQKVCILGCGRIGKKLAGYYLAFGASVTGIVQRVAATENDDISYCSFSEADNALQEADIVVCALPLTEETRGMLNADFFKKCKPGMLLINLSRAAIIQEDDLFSALSSGEIGGFASDVWWNPPLRGKSESYPSHNPFWEMDQVVLSPHRAGFVENCFPHLDGAIENIANLILDKPLQNLVDVQKKY